VARARLRRRGSLHRAAHGAWDKREAGRRDARLFVSQRRREEKPMIEKKASVRWEGPAKKGVGKISTETGALNAYPYGFGSRFEDDRRGTNPEEILGAAHAACFTMAFSFACDKAGFATAAIDTNAKVRLVQQGGGFAIDRIALTLDASVPVLFAASVAASVAAAEINVMLSGEQEVPPVATSAKGIGVLRVNPDRSVSGSITTSIADATAAHIHEGARGANGGVIVTLMKSGDRFSVPNGTRLTEAPYAALMAGRTYVNVHSPAHNDGEIRAQIVP
jgi:osmotically inducible protein OsmC